MFVLRSITRYSYYLFRGCHLYCFCLFQRSVRARFSQRRPIPIENGNLSMPENLVMTSAYTLCLSIQTLRVGLKTSAGREGSLRHICVAVLFDEKLTILWTTKGVAIVQLLLTKIVHFYDKSMKLSQITTNPKTNIFGYGAKPNSTLDTSTAQALKWPTWKRGWQWKCF